ncbi:MAG: penicillin-binding protein 1C [Kiritimatiellae bacterium]|nr:penicillin-binding protein 1C [Kiritimatiellia bacterium]
MALALGLAGLLALCAWHLAARWMPFPDHLLAYAPENLRLLDAEGGELRRILGADGLDAQWIPLEDTGEWAGPAIISVEDQRFARHGGVDMLAIVRATGQNLGKRGVVSGASTISTQVIRLIEPRPRTLRTKVIEAFRATQLEQRYDKDFILEQYLNRIPVGGNRQGLATASQRYYGKAAHHLSAGEAALIMGLPQSPARYSPNRHPERAEARRTTVLRRMKEEGVLREEPLLENGVRWVPPPSRAPHFSDWVLQSHRGESGELRTTLDPGVQRLLESVAEQARRNPGYAEVDGVGLVVMDARDGAIRGWVGGWDPDHPGHGQVDMVTRRRAPGSTLKPFAYGLAMRRGWLTPDSLLDDSPRAYRDYRPRNMDRQWDGTVSATDALVRSLNLPALEVARRLTTPDLLAHLREVGFLFQGARAEDLGLGLVIGGGVEVSLLELVSAYSAFAGDGTWVTPRGVESKPIEKEPIYPPAVSWWITRMLSGPERNLVLHGHAAETDQVSVAFKTGTSHGYRDAWTVGWNADWVIGVWVGRMDNRGVSGLTGATHAAPLLGEIVRDLFETESFAPKPEEIIAWQGREIIAGLTDPDLPAIPNKPFRIVFPTPNFEMKQTGTGPVNLPLRTAGTEGDPVHWYANGAWLGESSHVNLDPGEHHLRALGPDGQVAEVRVTVR